MAFTYCGTNRVSRSKQPIEYEEITVERYSNKMVPQSKHSKALKYNLNNFVSFKK